jgi:NitT/TauT family transport system substrate-binding protein
MLFPLVLAVALTLGTFQPASALEKVLFPYSPIGTGTLPYLVAKESKLYEKYNFDVDPVFVGAAPVIIQSMLAGEAHLAAFGGPAIVTNVARGGDVIQVTALTKTFTLNLYGQPAVAKMADLKGKKIGITRFGTVNHIMIRYVLRRAGVEGVELIQTGSLANNAAALESGNVAAALVSPPFNYLLKAKGYRELVGVEQLREMNIAFVQGGIVGRRNYANDKAPTVKNFIKATYEGLKRLYGDKEFAMKVLSKYTKVTDRKVLEDSYQEAVNTFDRDPIVPPEAMKTLVDELTAIGLVDAAAVKNIPITAYYTNRHVEELKREGFFDALWK